MFIVFSSELRISNRVSLTNSSFSLFFEIFTILVIIKTRKMKNKIKKFFKLSFSISFPRSSLSIEWRNLLFRLSQCFLFARDLGSYFILYTFIRLVYYTNLIHASSWDRSFQSFERRRDQSKWEKFVSREIQYRMLIKTKTSWFYTTWCNWLENFQHLF